MYLSMRTCGASRAFSRCFSSAKAPLVLIERSKDFAVLRMNNAPVNVLNTEMIQALDAEISTLEADKSCRGMILASSNPAIFSAGLDLMELYQPNPSRLCRFYTCLQNLYLRLYISRLACIAAIEGQSPAGGCLLAMCCDYRIMSTGKAKIGLNEAQIGLVAPTWFRDTLVNTIGFREAEKMLMLGLQVDATKAKALRMVDEICDVSEVLFRANTAMGAWLAIPDQARVQSKRMMRQETHDRLFHHKKKDLEGFMDFVQTDKVQRVLGKYLESLKKGK